MSAERLREAAKVLRERAEAASDESLHPWGLADEHDRDFTTVIDQDGWRVTEGPDQMLRETAAYIATMHPGVGLALADWLDDEAGRIEAATEDGTDARPWEAAVRLADLILGSQS